MGRVQVDRDQLRVECDKRLPELVTKRYVYRCSRTSFRASLGRSRELRSDRSEGLRESFTVFALCKGSASRDEDLAALLESINLEPQCGQEVDWASGVSGLFNTHLWRRRSGNRATPLSTGTSYAKRLT